MAQGCCQNSVVGLSGGAFGQPCSIVELDASKDPGAWVTPAGVDPSARKVWPARRCVQGLARPPGVSRSVRRGFRRRWKASEQLPARLQQPGANELVGFREMTIGHPYQTDPHGHAVRRCE